MSETPQSKPDRSLSDEEIAVSWRELDDRLSVVENGGGDRNTNEQLRLLRLMRTERHSYEMFANNFSSQAEALLRQVDEVVQPKLIELEGAAETSLAAIRTSEKKARGDKKLYLELQKGAQEAVDEMKNGMAEIKSAQEDLRTMINATMKRWNEQTQEITSANVESAAGAAAKEAFEAMNKEAIKEEVARQIRALGKQQSNG